MTAVPIPLFIFLTHSDSAYMSESSLSTEVCQEHDRGPNGLTARSPFTSYQLKKKKKKRLTGALQNLDK